MVWMRYGQFKESMIVEIQHSWVVTQVFYDVEKQQELDNE